MATDLTWASTSNSQLLSRLEAHPRVAEVRRGNDPGITFDQGGWRRRVAPDTESDLFGLVELIDNNPLVCADRFSCPGPVETLALAALGPLALSGAILEPPVFLANAPFFEEAIARALASVEWRNGIESSDEQASAWPEVLAATAIAVVEREVVDSLTSLYEERYSGCFFIRLEQEGDWSPALVKDRPWIALRLAASQDEAHGLVTVQALADIKGRVGALSLIHAMNVMAGFEESLGIA